MSRAIRDRLTLRLDRRTVDTLSAMRESRNLSMNEFISQILRRYIVEHTGDPKGGTLFERLDDLNATQREQRTLVEGLGEQLGLFILTWFAATSPVPVDQREAALVRAQERLDLFNDELVHRLRSRTPAPGAELIEGAP